MAWESLALGTEIHLHPEIELRMERGLLHVKVRSELQKSPTGTPVLKQTAWQVNSVEHFKKTVLHKCFQKLEGNASNLIL